MSEVVPGNQDRQVNHVIQAPPCAPQSWVGTHDRSALRFGQYFGTDYGRSWGTFHGQDDHHDETAIQLLLDHCVKPVTDRPCMIHFEKGGVSTEPIPANLIALETTDAGRILAKFAFDPVQATRDLIRHQKERRDWQRVVPRERRACLSWQVGDDTFSVPGEVRNISGGGVVVQTDVAPPWNQTIWLSLGPVGEEAGPAECRLVGFRNDQAGKLIARFAFADLCPLQLYQAAIAIPK